jgi:hypothetical protein
MDILDLVARRHKEAVQEQQERRRRDVARLKQQEEESSRKRMAELMEMERLRIEELKHHLAKERVRQRQMLTITFGLVGMFLILILIYAILNATG